MKIIISTVLLCFLMQWGYGQSKMDYFLIVGTYTSGKSEGIYVYRFDSLTAESRQVSIAKNIENPSFLCVDKKGEYIYAVSEKNKGEAPGGEIVAYQFVNPSGLMIEKKRISSMGNDPCYIALDPENQWFAAGNYSSGSLVSGSSMTRNEKEDTNIVPGVQDFSIVQTVKHSGSGINQQRQESPHVHAAVFSPDGKYVLTPDLGIDRVNVYAFDNKTGNLQYKKGKSITSEPGSGPRHLDFHPNGKWVYLIEELSSTVVFHHYHNGKLKKIQRINALAEGAPGTGSSADIHVSPDGRFLYCSNRGEANSISIFSINETGYLTLIGHQSTMGKTPRNFSISPGGKYMLVANQDSDDIVIFEIDPKTGLLKYTGKTIQTSKPVCLKWIKANL